MPRRLIRHHSKILSKERIEFPGILPGMIINFTYTEPTAYDQKPLILVLHRETVRGGASGLMHCLNFNYMYEGRIQFTGKVIDRFVPLIESNESFNKSMKKTFTRYAMNPYGRGKDSAKNVFKKVLGPRIMTTEDAYRTYKENKMKNMYVCYYDFKFLRERKAKGED